MAHRTQYFPPLVPCVPVPFYIRQAGHYPAARACVGPFRPPSKVCPSTRPMPARARLVRAGLLASQSWRPARTSLVAVSGIRTTSEEKLRLSVGLAPSAALRRGGAQAAAADRQTAVALALSLAVSRAHMPIAVSVLNNYSLQSLNKTCILKSNVTSKFKTIEPDHNSV